MSTGQTLITIFAFVLLATILTSFYGIVSSTGDDIASGQDNILATAVSTSWAEIAQGLAFDQVTDTSDIAFQDPTKLSFVLGRDNAAEKQDSVYLWNDFDDFNNAMLTKTAGTTGRQFTTKFSVFYVDSNNVALPVAYRTFTKRMVMKTWRTQPPVPAGHKADTLTTSLVLGYFHFN